MPTLAPAPPVPAPPELEPPGEPPTPAPPELALCPPLAAPPADEPPVMRPPLADPTPPAPRPSSVACPPHPAPSPTQKRPAPKSETHLMMGSLAQSSPDAAELPEWWPEDASTLIRRWPEAFRPWPATPRLLPSRNAECPDHSRQPRPSAQGSRRLGSPRYRSCSRGGLCCSEEHIRLRCNQCSIRNLLAENSQRFVCMPLKLPA